MKKIDILDVLITSIYPSDTKVVNAMNEINACKRMKEAMAYKGDAGKLQSFRTLIVGL